MSLAPPISSKTEHIMASESAVEATVGKATPFTKT
jgi:hypothetical protein